MKKFEIIDIGTRDGFYSDRKLFIGKTFISGSKDRLIKLGNDWFDADGNVEPKPLGMQNPFCFYRIRLKEII